MVNVCTYLQASKGAVIRFYETLRAELGSDVRVTIVMPGYVVSNLTMGKGVQKDGSVGIDEDARDVRPYIYLPLNHYKLELCPAVELIDRAE